MDAMTSISKLSKRGINLKVLQQTNGVISVLIWVGIEQINKQ